MNIFVTGSRGFVGTNFIKAAAGRGHYVYALTRSHGIPQDCQAGHVEWCVGGLKEDWTTQLSRSDALVHFAAAGVSRQMDDWDECFRVNLIEASALLRKAIECGVKKFLICGSCFEYGKSGEEYNKIPVCCDLKPVNAYASSKAAATMVSLALAASFDLKLTVVRPFHLYGKGEAKSRFWPQLVEAAVSGADFRMTAGEQVRDFMDVTDSVNQMLDIVQRLDYLDSGGCIKNIGSGRPMTLLDFAEAEWNRLGASGKLLPGVLPYRKDEVMRYVPDLS